MTDRLYETGTITEVHEVKSGWDVLVGNWGVFVPNESHEFGNASGVVPTVGATITLYGEGTGRPISGIAIDGMTVYYRTPEEQEAENERRAEQARQRLEQMEQESDEAIRSAGVMTEEQMRDAKVPTHDSLDDLTKYIRSLAERPQDYGTCVYSMSMAATAAFNYMARQLGATGFQAGAAEMDFLRHTRGLKWGKVLNYDDLLYPQYWTEEHFPTAMDVAMKHKEKIAKRAKAKLEENGGAHPNVLKHWKWLASLA